MKSTQSLFTSARLLRTIGLLASVVPFATLPLRAAEQEEPAPNFIEVGVGGVHIDGSKPLFRDRVNLKESAFGGIEALHFGQTLAEGLEMSIDGRAIYDQGDYLARLELVKKEVGGLRFNFDQFRTWYSNYAFYLPKNGAFFTPFDSALKIDRKRISGEAWLDIPDFPKITIRYEHTERSGEKPSTIWSDTNVTGYTGSTAARYIVPSYYDIDEKGNIFEIKASHTIGESKIQAASTWYQTETKDARIMIRRPTESAQRYLRHEEDVENDYYTAHAAFEHKFNDQLKFTTAALYTKLDGELSGDRVFGDNIDPVFDPKFKTLQVRDHGVIDLLGMSELHQWVFNGNLLYKPIPTISIVPSIRYEHLKQDMKASFIDTEGVQDTKTKVVTAIEEEIEADTKKDFDSVTASLDARYHGIPNWVFYASTLYSSGSGALDEVELEVDDPTKPVTLIRSINDYDRSQLKLAGGINWQALSNLKLAVQAYHKFSRNEFTSRFDSTDNTLTSADRYPSYLRKLEFTTDSINGRITWRIAPQLTSVSRIDFQKISTETASYDAAGIESANRDRVILSQSLTVNPIKRLSVMAGTNVVFDKLTTPANITEPTAIGYNLVQESEMDYLTLNLSAIYALEQDSDLMVNYTGYFSDNYSDNSNLTVPYGNRMEENSVVTTWVKRFTPNMVWTVYYGLYSYRDEYTGNKTDYTAHVFGTKMQYRF